MRIVFGFVFVFVFVFLFLGSGRAQQAYILVLDDQTKQPVPFVNVCFESIQGKKANHGITDNDGKLTNPVLVRSIVAISYVGYQTLRDTILPNQTKTFYMVAKIMDLDQVVVTAQYKPLQVDRSIYKVELINRKQMSQLGAKNLSDALALETNIRLTQDASLGTGISIQGLSGEHVKILIDGIPVIGRMNGSIDLSQLNLYNADHVEIIEGPMSVVYGSNAIAGAINIITRENKQNKLMLGVNTYYETVGIYNIDAAFSLKKGNHILQFSGGRNFFSGFSEIKDSRDKLWKPKEQYNADLGYIYSLPKLKIKASGTFFSEVLPDKGPLLSPYYETAMDAWFRTQRAVVNSQIDAKTGAFHFVNLLASYSYYERSKTMYYNDLTTLQKVLTTNHSDHDTTDFSTLLVRGSFSKSNELSKFNYQLGFDCNVETGKGKRILDNIQEIGDYAVYSSLNLKPSEAIEFQPGIRMSYNTRYSASPVYSLNAKWDVSKLLNMRASWSKGFRAPSLKELYLYFVDVNHNVQGNENLKAENSDNLNMAINFNHDQNNMHWTFETTFFYNSIHNIITLAQLKGLLYTYINVDQYKTTGGEINVSFRKAPTLFVKTGFGRVGRYNSLVKEKSTFDNYNFTTDFTTSVNYKFLRYETNFTIYYKYTGRLPQFYVDAQEQIKEGFIASYHTLDVSVSKSFFRNRLETTIGLKNLFDNKNISISGGAPSGGAHSSSGTSSPVNWGRTAFIKLGYSFNK
jgi:outer membrane receptor for ferrienterochelin and colicins